MQAGGAVSSPEISGDPEEMCLGAAMIGLRGVLEGEEAWKLLVQIRPEPLLLIPALILTSQITSLFLQNVIAAANFRLMFNC